MRVAVVDLVGTAVADDGLALDGVRRGLVSVGVPVAGPRTPALERQARAAMDRPVARMFADLLDGDQRRARMAADVYEAWLCDEAGAGRVHAVAGASAAIAALRAADLVVVLMANLSARTCERLVGASGLVADLLLGPGDVGAVGCRTRTWCSPRRRPRTPTRRRSWSSPTRRPGSGQPPTQVPAWRWGWRAVPTRPAPCGRRAPTTCSARWPTYRPGWACPSLLRTPRPRSAAAAP